MKVFIFVTVIATILPQISGLKFNMNENEELCSQMKDLSICKLRTLLDQSIREINEIMMSYSELTGFYGKLNEHASAATNAAVNSAKEKRKSAFVRFGKRSGEDSAAEHFYN